jgi:hypothetical protein
MCQGDDGTLPASWTRDLLARSKGESDAYHTPVVAPPVSRGLGYRRGRSHLPPARLGVGLQPIGLDPWGEIVGLHIGPSEAETFWSSFLKSLARRGLRGGKLVIS